MTNDEVVRLWCYSWWLVCILFVILWMIYGSMIVITDEQVARAAQSVRESRETRRQFEMFILASQATDQPKQGASRDIPIDPKVLAELRAAWLLIQEQATKAGISPEEYMRQVFRVIGKD